MKALTVKRQERKTAMFSHSFTKPVAKSLKKAVRQEAKRYIEWSIQDGQLHTS